MKKKCSKILYSFAALLLSFVVLAANVQAAPGETDPVKDEESLPEEEFLPDTEEDLSLMGMAESENLVITQEPEELEEIHSSQAYSFSYTPDGTEVSADRSGFDFEFEDGFILKSITTGNWSDYEGDLTVWAYDKDGQEVFTDTYAEAQPIDLQGYGQIRRVRMQTKTQAPANLTLDGVEANGEINTDQVGKALAVTVKYIQYAVDGTETVVAWQKASTICNKYEVGTPYVYVEPDELEYLNDSMVTINGISGEGFSRVNSYRVYVQLPDRMFVDSITLPEFDAAKYDVIVNGTQLDAKGKKLYVNRKVSEFYLNITPWEEKFEQESDLIIEMRNLEREESDEIVSATATVNYGKDISESKVSNEASIHFNPSQKPDSGDNDNDGDDGDDDPGHGDGEKPSGPEIIVPPVITPAPTNPTTTPATDSNTDSKNEEEKKEEEEPAKILDFSGLNLRSAKATTDSSNKIIDFRSSTSSGSTVVPPTKSRLNTTEVVDFTNQTASTDVSNGTVSGGSMSDSTPVDNIKMTPSEKVKDKVEKNVVGQVKENRLLQVVLGLLALIAIGAIVIVKIFKKGTSEEENPEGENGENPNAENADGENPNAENAETTPDTSESSAPDAVQENENTTEEK